MMEMDFNVVKNYFKLIHKHITSQWYFYNINRYISNRNLFGFKNFSEIGSSDLHDYPYDNNWEVLMAETSYRHSHMHTLITQRKKGDFKNNISDELKKIEKISKSFHQNSLAMRFRKTKSTIKNWLIFLILIFLRKFFSREFENKILNILIKTKKLILNSKWNVNFNESYDKNKNFVWRP